MSATQVMLRWVLSIGIGISLQIHAESTAEIPLGMSTALTGPAAKLGLNMRDGVAAAIAEANRDGGIQGKTLRLIALDDGYEPSRTAPNMQSLIDEHRVLAVVGNVGTPTAVASVPIAVRKKTLLFGAYTGAGVLRRTPPDRYVINYRASYAEETAAMVDGLITEGGFDVTEIAFFTQRDAYGDAGYSGGLEALKRHGLANDLAIAHGRYERNTDAVENGLADILGAPKSPRAIIMVGAYTPCAAFIKLAREIGLDAIFVNVSFVGSAPLAEALGDQGDGVIVTQVVPHLNSDLPIVTAYTKALAALDSAPSPTFGSLEGYIVGHLLIEALGEVEGAINREAIVDALESMGEFDLGLGVELFLSAEKHQACHQVWPTVIRDGKVIPFSWGDLRKP